MSSETTELTFVRCPSCRSLVPATATRCRICNNPLDGGNKSEENDAAKAASRIRQKTISASADEMAETLAEVNGGGSASQMPQSPPVPPAPSTSPPVVASEEDSEIDFDPLGAYLQELEEAEEAGLVEFSPATEDPLAATGGLAQELDDDLDPFDLDIFDELDDEPAPKPTFTPPPEPIEESAKSAPRAAQPAAPAPAVEKERAPEAVRETKSPEPPPARAAQDAGRPRGMAPQGARPGGTVDPDRSARQGDRRAHEPRQSDERGPDPRRAKDPQPQRSNNQPQHQQPKRDARGEQRNEPLKGNHGARGGHEHRSDQRAENRPPAQGASDGPRPGKIQPGRLAGWFVSYENPDGRAIEVREGKFFVTGSSIKAADLVIEDASISTPHALMSVGSDGVFKVQDLMSERGLFVRSRDGGQYKREEGTVELKHGDWIRFGDVEFLVALVPTGSGR
jgi:hypothetical protein